MGFIEYMTASSPAAGFGTLAWIFFLLQLIGVAAGAYFIYAHSERNPARQAFARQLGIALLILGGVGLLVAVLRLLGVPVISQRVWFWVLLLVDLTAAGYITFYIRKVLPDLEKAQASKRSSRPTQQRTSAEPQAPPTPRPVATTSRREARRERKKKK
jgi:4-amino-4-deoxy-L-arabinose transferase-like glycosyltransferase